MQFLKYRNLQLLVEKFTPHILSASHKWKILELMDKYAPYDTWSHILLPRSCLFFKKSWNKANLKNTLWEEKKLYNYIVLNNQYNNIFV